MLDCDGGGVNRVTTAPATRFCGSKTPDALIPTSDSFGVLLFTVHSCIRRCRSHQQCRPAPMAVVRSPGPTRMRSATAIRAPAMRPPGSQVAQLNNYATPEGGPAECRWSVEQLWSERRTVLVSLGRRQRDHGRRLGTLHGGQHRRRDRQMVGRCRGWAINQSRNLASVSKCELY